MTVQLQFATEDVAQSAVKKAGFCLGEMARDEPRGLMHDYDYVAKWRNLTAREKSQLHGAYQRHGRGGPVTITLQKHCPQEHAGALEQLATDLAT